MPDIEQFDNNTPHPTPPAASLVGREPDEANSAGARQLLDLVRDSPACLASLAGPDHMVTVTNQRFRGLFGNRPLVGLPLRAALPELTSQPFFSLLDEAYANGRTCYGLQEVAYHGRAGHNPVHFTFIGQAVRNADGTVTGLLLFAYDVSAHVLARQWVETHEEYAARTRQQLAVANEKLSITNEELDVTNEELTVSNHELSVTNLELALANERLSVANEQLRATNEEICLQAAELRRAEAAVRQLNDELMLTNDGLVETVSSAVEEVEAARREAEAQRQRLHRLVAEAPALIAVLSGPEHRFQLVNEAFQHLLGNRTLMGQPFREALPELAGQLFGERLEAVYRTGVTYHGTDEPAALDRTNTGQLQMGYFNYIYQATQNAAGCIDGILVFAYDVTAQVLARQVLADNRQQLLALNQQLAAVNEKLYAANAQLGDANVLLVDANDQLGDSNQHLTFANTELDTFVYTASHDLQNPITNLEGLLGVLREELPDECQAGPAARILELMHDSVERFQRTLGHLAAITRLAPALGVPPVPVSLAEVVRDVLLDLALPITATGAQVEVDVAACPAVAFPESNLRSIIYNLLSNAIKYQRPGLPPRVEVRSRMENGGCVLEVEDNGLGLSAAQQAQLFGLFQRLHAHVDGSGVGLYMVKRMVENSGGRIAVESQPGVGSIFSVYFKG
ncbi:PAS domain-containing sensor histidine kinase [Hymenobacter sp. DG25B]|uniref:PAS domain-containing sensor histidine kinase n=1 Tax=Hymenobacter sp. DG25B TaxID=1385664 RepID=UPI0009005E6C|nr:PAS domain-containing sensor histidine kinase [Hymenobacter sp. DG25B]